MNLKSAKKLFLLFLLPLTLFAQQKNIDHNTIIDSNLVLKPESQHKLVNLYVDKILSTFHYKKVALDDSLSSLIYDKYIKSLDNNKMYFLKSDIEKFEKYRYRFDDFLKKGQLDVPFEIFNLYKARLNERIKAVNKILEKGFDFNKDEFIIPNRKNMPWAETKEELDDLWRKNLKNDALNRILSKSEWKDVKKSLLSRYHTYHKIVLQYNPEDVFQIYMNAFTESIDPHTNYLSPKTSEQFDIDMKLSLEGIGASLRLIDDYTTVMEIIPGGPAAKSKALHPDDKIIGVAQGDTGKFVDVIGWRIDDTVQLIRGKKGTVVRLRILRANSSPSDPADTIRLVRDKVKLEDKAASKEVFTIEENNQTFKLGVIKIPSFYADFGAINRGEKNYRSTTRDVKKLITELNKEGIDALIIDLRNDGGGSLQEAISLTGLFIKEGPVVQVRNSNEKIEVGKDPDPSIFYDGPLGVMVNRYSASASEIFSGAIQDYGRGIIIGEQTYGKGTVQNLIDLKRYIPFGDKSKLGRLKLTIAKFYRITGSSTQHKGVIPDIKYPSYLDPSEYGESVHKTALPWDMISSTDFNRYYDLSKILPEIEKKHEERIKNNKEFEYLLEDIAEYKAKKAKNKFSLKMETRKAEREKSAEKKNKRNNERGIKVKDKEEKTEKKEIKIKDPQLEEAGHVVIDLAKLTANK